MDEQLLNLIRCPITFESLQVADQSLLDVVNEAIRQGRLRNQAGVAQRETLTAGLVNVGRQWLYSIRNDIPSMVPEEAIDLRTLDSAAEEPTNHG